MGGDSYGGEGVGGWDGRKMEFMLQVCYGLELAEGGRAAGKADGYLAGLPSALGPPPLRILPCRRHKKQCCLLSP